MSKELNKPLHREWWVLTKSVRKQMAVNGFNKEFEGSSDILSEFTIWLLVFSIALFLIT